MFRAVAWCVAVAVVAGLCWADPAPVVQYKVLQWLVGGSAYTLDGENHGGFNGPHSADAVAVAAQLTDLALQGWEVVCCETSWCGEAAGLGFYTLIYTLKRQSPAESQYDLTQGWNMIGIGQIGQGQIPLASVSFSDGVETKTWDEAVTAGWIQATAYRYEPGTGYVDVCPACAENCFMPGTGYLLLTFVDDLTLLLP